MSDPDEPSPDDVSATVNAYLAMRAALSAVEQHNASSPPSRIDVLMSPGLATAVGGMDPEIAARQMRRAWASVIEGRRERSLEEARRSQAALRGRRWALDDDT